MQAPTPILPFANITATARTTTTTASLAPFLDYFDLPAVASNLCEANDARE